VGTIGTRKMETKIPLTVSIPQTQTPSQGMIKKIKSKDEK
jgi:hypothetical protein